MPRKSPNIPPSIRRLMEGLNWPVEIKVLANKADVNRVTLTQNFAGTNAMSLNTAIKILTALQVKSDLILILKELDGEAVDNDKSEC